MAHAAVWIDHREAKIFRVKPEELARMTLEAPHHQVRRHPVVSADKDHAADEATFFHAVAEALAGSDRILVVGPASAKHELVKYLGQHDPALAAKVVAVEPVDHPTNPRLFDRARRHFATPDAARGTAK